MLAKALWVLRQPRYAALAALMAVIALACIAAGSWQISRFTESVHDNAAMDHNARAVPIALSTTLVPLLGNGPAPGRDAIRYRSVTASGVYLAADQQLLRNESLNGVNGYDVIDPMVTADGAVLLVERGFIAAAASGAPPAAIAAPPSGQVSVTGRLQTTGTRNDKASSLPDGEIEAITPARQAARLGRPVFQTYITLDAGQPGTSGVTALPNPDLSNPAGGAYQWQHFAYVIQWYVFALLALAAPFAMHRSEVRDAQRRFLGIDPARIELGTEPFAVPPAPITAAASTGAEVAVAGSRAVAPTAGPTRQQWRRAARLADRYGLSLGIDAPPESNDATQDSTDTAASPRDSGVEALYRLPDSSTSVHRSEDDRYHGAYNDYLWQLGLADGDTPDISLTGSGEPRERRGVAMLRDDQSGPSARRRAVQGADSAASDDNQPTDQCNDNRTDNRTDTGAESLDDASR